MSSRLRSCTVGPSGQTLCLLFEDLNGVLTNVASVNVPTVTITGDGLGATAVLYLDNTGALAVRVVNPGSGYSVAGTTATVSGGTGDGGIVLGSIVVDANGKITSIPVLAAGSGYWPTYSVNGGPAVGLSDPLWGADSSRSKPTPYVPFLIFPLAAPIAANATVTVTFPDGWLTTVAGSVASITAVPCTNAVGGSLLPAFPSVPKTMGLGWNIGFIDYFSVPPFYSNAAYQCPGGPALTMGPGGYPVSGFPVSTFICLAGADACDPLGYPMYPSDGTWTLTWDGPYSANVTITPFNADALITKLSDTPGANGQGNTRTYRVQATNYHTPRFYLNLNAAGATNIKLYPPGEPIDGSERFAVNTIRQAQGAACIRFMTPLGTNNSFVAQYGDFGDPANFSIASRDPAVQPFPHVPIASVDPYTPSAGDAWYLKGFLVFQLTTSAPHGCTTGQCFAVEGVTLPSGGVMLTNGVKLGGISGNYIVRVMDSTHLTIQAFGSGTTNPTLPQSYPQTSAFLGPANDMPMPPADCVAFSNRVGADVWLNVPHAATDDCVTKMAQMAATTLASGKKCYVEYTNEHWNPGFAQYRYFFMVGNTMPGSGATATATVDGTGKVTGLTVTNAGTGYVMAPTVTIAAPVSGATATAHATLINGVLQLVVDTPGSGYSAASPPTVTITPGVFATAAYLYRAVQIHNLFRAAFTAAGRPATDVVRVVGTQDVQGGTLIPGIITSTAARNGWDFDLLATAVYLDNNFGAGNPEPGLAGAMDRFATADMLHDFSQLTFQYGPAFPTISGGGSTTFANLRGLLDSNGLSHVGLCAYEGSLGFGVNSGTNDLAHRTRAWARHPRARELQLYILQRLQDDAGLVLEMDFVLAGPQVSPSSENWSKYQARSMLPGLGDGSDGLFDNRTNPYDLSQIVSVLGGAIRTWQGLVGGAPFVPFRPRALAWTRARGRRA